LRVHAPLQVSLRTDERNEICPQVRLFSLFSDTKIQEKSKPVVSQSRRQTSNPHDSVPHCAAGAGCVTTSRASTGEPGAARRSDHGCGRAPDSVAGAAAPKCFFSLRREGAKCKSSAAQRFFFGRSAPDTCTSARTSLCSSAVSRVTWQT
jgi:hypothetical protein